MKLSDLYEGRDAPLYHGTGMAHLIMIMHDNAILGSKSRDAIGKHRSVRLSRNLKIAKAFSLNNAPGSGGGLVLDQAMLSHDYKMQPFADQGVGATRSNGDSEFEEVVFTDAIKPLNKYLTKLIISDKSIKLALEPRSIMQLSRNATMGMDQDEIRQAIIDLANHPLRGK